MSIESNVRNLVLNFANELYTLLHSMPLADLDDTAPKYKTSRKPAHVAADKPARLPKRTPEEVLAFGKALAKAAGKKGATSEQLRVALSCDKREIPLPIKVALAAGFLRKTGEKRATVYYAVTKSVGKKSAKKSAASAKPSKPSKTKATPKAARTSAKKTASKQTRRSAKKAAK